ncbi:MAG: pseudouridine synthase [Bacteroidetes bacterium]|nr:MAG: pseudouridine synthase [Bacteroidota bacterium]
MNKRSHSDKGRPGKRRDSRDSGEKRGFGKDSGPRKTWKKDDSEGSSERRSYGKPKSDRFDSDRRNSSRDRNDRSRDSRGRDERPRDGRFRDSRSNDRRDRNERSDDRRDRSDRSRDDRSGDKRFRDDRSGDRRFRDDRSSDRRERSDRSDDRRDRDDRSRDDRSSDRRFRDDRPRDGRGRFKKKPGFNKDRRRDDSSEEKSPRLKKTRNYRDKDREIIGNWREDLPEDRKTSRKKPQDSKRQVEPRQITEEVRLNRYIANSGICSRREADEFIENGAVTVNGQVIKELGSRVQPGDEVRFKGRIVLPEKAVYIIMNKPKDCITTVDDPEGRRTVMDIISDEVPERVFPIGRLDRNTTGVLLLTNDGDLSQKLTHPSFGVHKVYQATLNKALTKTDMETLLKGVELEDGTAFMDEIAYLDESKSTVGVEIHSGKNRIIHRMFNHLGYLVDKLDRVSFAGLTKDRIKRGEFRYLNEKEVRILFKETGKKQD